MIASLAFRNVLRNKERSLLTLVGVVLAIGSFVALVSLATGFTSRVERELGSREVHLYVTGSRSSMLPTSPLSVGGGASLLLPIELREILESVDGVRSVTPVIRTAYDAPRSVIPVLALPLSDASIVFKGAQLPNVAFPEDQAGSDPELTKTEWGLWVGRGLRRDVEEALLGGVLLIDEVRFTVAGQMGNAGFLDFMLLAPLEAFQSQRERRGVHEFWLTVGNEAQAEQIKNEIEARLAHYVQSTEDDGLRTAAQGARVLTRRQYQSAAKDYLKYGWLLQVAVSMVGVLIAVTASMNTMLMSTYERLGEYATLRAFGASRRVVSLTILYEATFLNVTGGLLGLLFGYLATGVLDRAVGIILEIPYPMAGVTPALLLQALCLSFAVGLAGAIIPCFLVSRLDLVAQLRKGM